MQLPSIELSRLHPHPNNPRTNLGDLAELSESIKARGIQQNLTVVPVDVEQYHSKIKNKKAYTGDFTIVIGHRRRAAAELAGLTEVPCRIDTDMDLKEQLALMLAENMQRKELALLEEAQGIQLMLDWGDSIKEISGRTGLSESTVRRRVKIVKTFGKEAIERVQGRPIDLNDYEQCYKVDSPEKRAEVFEQIGTKEFDWALKAAITQQEKDEQKAQLIRMIAAFATETSPDEGRKATKSHYWNFYRYDTGDLDSVGELAAEAENSDGKFDGIELFYMVEQGFSGITVYAIASEEDDAEVKKVAAQEEKERKEAVITRIKDMFKQAYDMRLTFAKRFTTTAETADIVNRAAALALFSVRNANEDVIRALLGIDKKFRPTWEKGEGETREEAVGRLIDECQGSAVSKEFFFKGAYSRLEPGNVAAIDHSGKYSDREALNQVYEFLKSLGYTTSDEEQKLIDGTHAIYFEVEMA